VNARGRRGANADYVWTRPGTRFAAHELRDPQGAASIALGCSSSLVFPHSGDSAGRFNLETSAFRQASCDAEIPLRPLPVIREGPLLRHPTEQEC
jgi:hypothetical protein